MSKFPKDLLRKARRMIELRYPDIAWYVGAEAAYWIGIRRNEWERDAWADARTELRAAPESEILNVLAEITDACDRAVRDAGWEALRAELSDVQPWSPERISRYAERYEQECENAAARWYEDAAYGR